MQKSKKLFFKGVALKSLGLRRRLGFTERVRSVVRHIPRGKTLTYKQVAARAGNPSAARAVGMIMSKNLDESVPCHRVIRSDGRVGGYNRGGAPRKIELLMQERYTRA